MARDTSLYILYVLYFVSNFYLEQLHSVCDPANKIRPRKIFKTDWFGSAK
jgi:hypothetical protein